MLSNALSVQEYKKIFDENDYKSNCYEMAKFITFLMNKSVVNKEIESLTDLKKSQVFSYKKVIKHNKTEELKSTAFRKVLKSCTDSVSATHGGTRQPEKPKVEQDLVKAIESEATGLWPLSISPSPPKSKGSRGYYERPHIFNEYELSPGKSTFYKNDFCPCGLPTGSAERFQEFVHIPEFEISTRTFLELEEVDNYEREIFYLKKERQLLRERVQELMSENAKLRGTTVKRTSV